MSEAEELIDQTQPIRKVRQIGDSPVRSETSVPHVSAPRESVPIGPSEPTPEATVGISPEVVAKVIVACPRCGAKLVRLAETPVVSGWVNLDCPTPGCGHVKPVKETSDKVTR